MAFRFLKFIVGITSAALFYGTALGQAPIGDWEFRVQSENSEIKARVASTLARPYSGDQPRPTLVIRQMKADSPVELLITATHDNEKDKCDYKDWKIMIDGTDVPVLGYTFEPTKTELKPNWGTPEDKLWSLFRKGLQLTAQVQQKCDSFSGDTNLKSYTFSLRGSSAAYKFVTSSVE